MTITHADFLRLLPKALAGYQYDLSPRGSRGRINSSDPVFIPTPNSNMSAQGPEQRHRPQDEHSIRVTMEAGSVNIQLAPETIRRIGGLELPVTEVTFQFENSRPDAIQFFLDRFNRAYHKGGG